MTSWTTLTTALWGSGILFTNTETFIRKQFPWFVWNSRMLEYFCILTWDIYGYLTFYSVNKIKQTHCFIWLQDTWHSDWSFSYVLNLAGVFMISFLHKPHRNIPNVNFISDDIWCYLRYYHTPHKKLGHFLNWNNFGKCAEFCKVEWN